MKNLKAKIFATLTMLGIAIWVLGLIFFPEITLIIMFSVFAIAMIFAIWIALYIAFRELNN